MACALVSSLAAVRAAEQTAPVPPAPVQTAPAPDPRLTGVPMFPGAEFLTSYDAGRDQRQFLFGTNTPYAEVVAYYKTQFKSSGRELFRTPPMQQFDLARFMESTMAYQPSVVVKDYAWMDSPGYLHVSGTTEKRYKTIIQIVPAAK
jgi:hypothetical protein